MDSLVWINLSYQADMNPPPFNIEEGCRGTMNENRVSITSYPYDNNGNDQCGNHP